MCIWKSQTRAQTTQNGSKMISHVGQLTFIGIPTHTNNTAEPLLDGLQLQGKTMDKSKAFSGFGSGGGLKA